MSLIIKFTHLHGLSKLHVLLLALIFFITACDDSDDAKLAEDKATFTDIPLTSQQEVPSNNSSATGSFTGEYEKNSNRLTYTINYTGVTATAMHFHKAPIGMAGSVEMEVPGPYSSGMTGTLNLTEAQETDFLAGQWYLNIHSAAIPAGEIRGQIVPENMIVLSNMVLNAKQEVPGNTSTATGTFNALYDKSTKVLAYAMTLNGITPAGMHIHKGAVGVAGDVVTGLTGTEGTTAALTAEQEMDLLAGNLYVNVHSEAYPGGEIRGQIVTQNQVVFSNDITAESEVPASSSTASGAFYGLYDKAINKLSYTINYTGTTPTAMHLHKGAVGVAGDVEIGISGPYSSGMTGAVTLTDAQEVDLLGGQLYLNVHSGTYPAGEIRAQLVK